jgi:hypothetical protein
VTTRSSSGGRGFHAIAVDLSDRTLVTPDGQSVRLGALVDRPAMLVLVRYYG